MRDYEKAIAALLLPLVNEAIGAREVGGEERAVYSLQLALEGCKVRALRDELLTAVTWRCHECNRHWSVTMTVKAERELRGGPETCPECFNAFMAKHEDSERSQWTIYKYVNEPNEEGE
jgi:ribosomal protein S27AE